jgi:hypothetical protein
MFREYLWPHCGWSSAETVEITTTLQNKPQISNCQRDFLSLNIVLLSSPQKMFLISSAHYTGQMTEFQARLYQTKAFFDLKLYLPGRFAILMKEKFSSVAKLALVRKCQFECVG